MIAVIGDSGNAGSIALHTKLKFQSVRMSAVGFKFGCWVDTVQMQKAFGPGSTLLPAPGSVGR